MANSLDYPLLGVMLLQLLMMPFLSDHLDGSVVEFVPRSILMIRSHFVAGNKPAGALIESQLLYSPNYLNQLKASRNRVAVVHKGLAVVHRTYFCHGKDRTEGVYHSG